MSGIPGNNLEMNMLRGGNPRDAGKSPSFQAAVASNMPFKEQHLKQLRAQCLVFLAFRNRMIPKKLHLDIALGNFIPKEDGPSKELIDHKGKELSINDQSNIPEGTMLFGRLNDARETKIVRQCSTSTGLLLEANLLKESKDPSMIQEMAESQAILAMGSQPDSLSARHLAVSYGKDDLEKGQAGIENQAASVIGVSKEMKPEMVSWTGIASHNEAAKGSVPGSMLPQESVPERKDIAPFQSQIPADSNIQRSRHAESHFTSFPSRDHWKPFSGMEAEHQRMEPVKDASVLAKNVSEGSKYMSEDDQTISEIQRRSIPCGFKTVVDDMRRNGSPTVVETDQEEQDISLCTDLPPNHLCVGSISF